MALDICAVPLQTINPNCRATSKPGGANKRMYRGKIEDIAAMTFDASGAIASLTMKTGKKLYLYNGLDFSNTASVSFNRADNGSVEFPHSVTFLASYISQAELNAIETALLATGTFAIVQTNSGQLLVYGLNGPDTWKHSTGLRVNSSESGIGTASGDASTVPLNMTGTADAPMRYYVGTSGNTLNDNLDDLDAML